MSDCTLGALKQGSQELPSVLETDLQEGRFEHLQKACLQTSVS